MVAEEAAAAPAREIATEATTLAELSREVNKWTLHTDHDLHVFLKNYSAQLFERTKHLENSVRDVAAEADAAHVRLLNTFNQFQMLSNNQFIENRVYDEEQEELEEELAAKASQQADGAEAKDGKPGESMPDANANANATAPTKATNESVVTKYRNALEMGIEAMKLFATMDDDRSSTESDPFDSILDIYNERPLPYIIGTREFLEDDTLGLGAGPDTSSESESDSDSESYSSSDVSDGEEDSESVASSEGGTRASKPRKHSSAESDASSTESGGLFGTPSTMQRQENPQAEKVQDDEHGSEDWSEESDSDESEDSKPIVRRRKGTEEVTNTPYQEPRPQATTPKAHGLYASESSEDESGEEGLFGGPKAPTSVAAKPTTNAAPKNDLFSELKARVGPQEPEQSSLFEDQESEVSARMEKPTTSKRTEPIQAVLPSRNFFSESDDSDNDSTVSGLFGSKSAPSAEKTPSPPVLFPPKAVEDASSKRTNYLHDSSEDESDSGVSSPGGLFGAKPKAISPPPIAQAPPKNEDALRSAAKPAMKSSLFDDDDSDDDSGNELIRSKMAPSVPSTIVKSTPAPIASPSIASSANLFGSAPALGDSSDDDDDGGLFGVNPGNAKPAPVPAKPALVPQSIAATAPPVPAPAAIQKVTIHQDDSDISDGGGLFGAAPKKSVPSANVNEASAMSLFGPSPTAAKAKPPPGVVPPSAALPTSTPARSAAIAPPAMKMPTTTEASDSDSDWSDDGQSLFGVSAVKKK